MDIFIPIFICFTIFLFCSLCGLCCRRRNQGAVLSPPAAIVITSQTHQVPVGPYPVTVSQTHQAGLYQPGGQPVIMQNHGTGTGFYPMPHPQIPMQQPMPGYTPLPPQGQEYSMPMPGGQPPYPLSPSAPGISAQQVNPPSYDQVVGNNSYQKQEAYNPNFTG